MKKAAIVLMTALLVFGCGHFRHLAISETQPSAGVQTKNRYRLFQFCVRQDGKYANLNKDEFASVWEVFKSTVPNVFAEDGKPIAVYLDSTGDRSSKYGWTFLFPFLLSAFTLPMWSHNEWRSSYSIRFKRPKKVDGGLRNTYTVKMEFDLNMSCYTPISLFFSYSDPGVEDGRRPFCRSGVHTMGEIDQSEKELVVNSAIAYGAACTLKRLEEDGTLPDVWEDADIAPVVVSEPSAVPVAPVAPSPLPAGGGSGGSGVVEIDSIPL